MEALADYHVLMVSDLYILIADCKTPGKPSLTQSAAGVLMDLAEALSRAGASIGSRRVFYRDSVGRFDELLHSRGVFIGHSPIASSQQEFFKGLALD